MFPFHLRLSIHAHNNAGPKFGIKLLSADQVKVITSIDELDAPKTVDYLHIPTPWHNSILKIDNSDYFYVIKSGSITESIANGQGTGEWNKDELYFEYTPQLKNYVWKI
jgi:pyoverdine/dityrosine biosynthesis protein Dit1